MRGKQLENVKLNSIVQVRDSVFISIIISRRTMRQKSPPRCCGVQHGRWAEVLLCSCTLI